MTTATLRTLLVVPVFYSLFDDARQKIGALVSAQLRRASAPRPAAALPPPESGAATGP